MSIEVIEFVVDSGDVIELDRLAAIYTGGDRDALLHEAIRHMGSRDRAARIQGVQQRIHTTLEGRSGPT